MTSRRIPEEKWNVLEKTSFDTGTTLSSSHPSKPPLSSVTFTLCGFTELSPVREAAFAWQCKNQFGGGSQKQDIGVEVHRGFKKVPTFSKWIRFTTSQSPSVLGFIRTSVLLLLYICQTTMDICQTHLMVWSWKWNQRLCKLCGTFFIWHFPISIRTNRNTNMHSHKGKKHFHKPLSKG